MLPPRENDRISPFRGGRDKERGGKKKGRR